MTYRDELRAALDRAEAAERRLDSVCAVHPQAPVAAACALCEKRLCTACVMMSIAGTFCGPCFVKERQRELRRRLVVVTAGVGAIVASVLGAIWFWRPAHVIQPPSVVFPPPSPEERLLMLRARLAERLGRDGSDIEGWLRLVRSYMVLGDTDKARAAVGDARRALASDPGKLRQLDDFVKGLGLDG